MDSDQEMLTCGLCRGSLSIAANDKEHRSIEGRLGEDADGKDRGEQTGSSHLAEDSVPDE